LTARGRFAVVVLGAALLTSGSATGADPGTAEDVRVLVAFIEEVHPNPYHEISRDAFHRAADDLVARLPSLDRDQSIVETMRLIAMLGTRDGHSGIFPTNGEVVRPLHAYPVRVYWFADGFYVLRAADASLERARLVSIAGRPVEEVAELVRPLVTHDNDWTIRQRLPGWLMTAEVLHGLRVTESAGPAAFGFVLPNGERREVTLAPIDVAAFDPLYGFNSAPVLSGRPPLWLRQPAAPLTISTLQRGRVVYVSYKHVTVQTGPAAQRILRFAKAKRFRRVIVDVRLNGGGDNTTYRPLLAALRSRSVNRYARPVVLVGRATFSAAQNFITELEQRPRPVFVGEPSGGSPNLYGDNRSIDLPGLGLTAFVPQIYWMKSRPDDPRVQIDPDVRIELGSADFFAGRDPVLAAALALPLR
jgi:hypothetical protein